VSGQIMVTNSPRKWHNNIKTSLRNKGFEKVNLNWILILSSGGLSAVTVMKFLNF
jgi:hypothetical protein